MKVSDGCKNCYAETLDNQYNHENPHWGPGSPRKLMSDKYWHQPIKWNEAAIMQTDRPKVFCASMADVFEDHQDIRYERDRLFAMIDATPWLIWQLLTKRPENINRFIPDSWRERPRHNVWFGTSVENDKVYDRIEAIVQVDCVVRFLSCEPLLGPITLPIDAADGSAMVEWVIAGGESGPGARPMHPDWVRSLRDQCEATGTPFFFKQWGEYLPRCQADYIDVEFTEGKRVVGFQSPHNPDKTNYYLKVGKHLAGARLDGVEYKEFPCVEKAKEGGV